MTPQEVIDIILSQAPKALKEDKSHAPILFVFGEREDALVSLDFVDTDSKIAAMLISGGKLAFLKPHCVAMVCEAWMSRTMPPNGKAVSDMPDRQEALQLIAQNREGDTKAVTIPFSRVGDEIVLGEPVVGEEVESYLLELFWKGVG